MKIIVRKSDNVVLMGGADYQLSARGVVVDKVLIPSINTATVNVVEVNSLPRDFASGNYTYTNATWALTDRGRAAVLQLKLAALAALRYEKETLGITINGAAIFTDRASQAMLTGAMAAMQIDPSRVIDWKGGNGWIQLNALSIAAISSVIATYVQACFTREKELSEALVEDVTTDITAGWPVTVYTL